MKYVLLGKIVNTHGIKGELRIMSDFKYKERIFKKNMNLYIGKDKIKEVINSYRKHKYYDMVCFDNYSNINEVLKYKGNLVYFNKDDLILNANEYLNEDLINLDVIIDDIVIGQVLRIENYPSSEMIRVKNDKKEYLIPYVSDIIESINLLDRKIIVKNIKGLI